KAANLVAKYAQSQKHPVFKRVGQLPANYNRKLHQRFLVAEPTASLQPNSPIGCNARSVKGVLSRPRFSEGPLPVHTFVVLSVARSAHPSARTMQRIEFRMGINVGDIIIEDGDIFGDGVNIAARLEALAEPGGICLSAAAHEQVRD